jgi:hypothetical protein
MKKITCFLFAASAIVLCNCNFSVGTKKDLSTGLSYSYNGFSVGEVVLVDADNMPKSNNEVQLNSQVALVVQGLTNYELKDNKAFPGLMLMVTDKDGVAVINEADLFAGNEGYAPEDAAVLRGSITVGTPMKTGETYHVKMRVWDKNKVENELSSEVDLEVK